MEAATFAANAPIELRYVAAGGARRASARSSDPVDARRGVRRRLPHQRAVEHHGGRLGPHRHVVLASLDILAWLHLEVLEGDDVCFSSKGHDAPAVYAVLAGDGQARLRRCCTGCAGSDGLPGPSRTSTPCPRCTPTPARSGMGVSKAKGFARAARLAGRPAARVRHHRRRRAAGGPVLGVARPGRQRGLRRDHGDRRPQQDPVRHVGRAASPTSATSRPRSRAFGWAVARCDGNDVGGAWRATLERRCSSAPDRPKLLVADTVKGAGVARLRAARRSSASGTALYAYHSGAPAPDAYAAALAELAGRLERAARARLRTLRGRRGAAARRAGRRRQRLVAAYGAALADGGRARASGSSRSTPTSTSTAG